MNGSILLASPHHVSYWRTPQQQQQLLAHGKEEDLGQSVLGRGHDTLQCNAATAAINEANTREAWDVQQ